MNYNDYKKYYYNNGNISYEHYYLNDNYHRTDGPAYISYYKNGNINREFYYLNGKHIGVNSNKEFEKYVKHLILK